MTVTNVPKMTKNDSTSVPLFGSVHSVHWLLKEPIISSLKFKMANYGHIENVLGRIFCFPTAFLASTSGGFRVVSDSKGNYSATSNNTKLVHWPLMGVLVHLVPNAGTFGTARRGLGRLRLRPVPSCCTKCNSPSINCQCTNHCIAI